ncbi:MAG: MAPEG family protein [Pseudomonadota bacterium]|nr:MAPEG family protein [Pseudomonadota bacterium]
MEQSPILLPVAVLVAWSIVMMLWMVVTRFAAFRARGISLKGAVGGRPGMFDGMVDDRAQWKAHNYIHLMEQPTLFYAIALTLALIGEGDGLNETLAWAYVALRVVHSFIQATVNIILYRFLVFTLASLALIGLTVNALLALTG